MTTDLIAIDGAQIRAARFACRLKVYELAAKVSISASHLSAIEKGTRKPSPETLGRIADVLQLTSRSLVTPIAPPAIFAPSTPPQRTVIATGLARSGPNYPPTGEQQAVIDAFGTGNHLVIDAAAGAGKTSTLKFVAHAAGRKKGIYFAYNKVTADEAARDFPANVTCKTSHALAMGAVGGPYRARLNGPRRRPMETALALGIMQPIHLGTDVDDIPVVHAARLAMETVKAFCYSDDDTVAEKHVPRVNGLTKPAVRDALAKVLVPIAQQAWDRDLTRTSGILKFEHDHYLKIWALGRPQLDVDFVMLDEAQDTNGCVTGVVKRQHAQKILVGDRFQSLYGWRGATNAMGGFDGIRLALTQSFRFGPAIAAEANKWLEILGADFRVRGYDKVPSRLGELTSPHAVLCRTNASVVSVAAAGTDAGLRVAIVGGGTQIVRLAEAAMDLQDGRRTSHPELFAFKSWDEVLHYVEHDAAGGDLQVAVNLIEKYKPAGVVAILNRLVSEDRADLIVSTAHRSKGREWATVQIHDDFPEPRETPENPRPSVSDPAAMLAYVAVTRAKLVLDRKGLAWVDGWI